MTDAPIDPVQRLIDACEAIPTDLPPPTEAGHFVVRELVDAARGLVATITDPARGVDLPYEDVPGDPVPGQVAEDRFADFLTVKAATLPDVPGVGAVVFEFAMGHPLRGPVPVTSCAFLAPPAGLRKAGTLVRDAMNGAANRTELLR